MTGLSGHILGEFERDYEAWRRKSMNDASIADVMTKLDELLESIEFDNREMDEILTELGYDPSRLNETAKKLVDKYLGSGGNNESNN